MHDLLDREVERRWHEYEVAETQWRRAMDKRMAAFDEWQAVMRAVEAMRLWVEAEAYLNMLWARRDAAAYEQDLYADDRTNRLRAYNDAVQYRRDVQDAEFALAWGER